MNNALRKIVVSVLSLRVIALCTGCITMVACGGSYFVGFVSNPVGNASITGTVMTVNTGFASDPAGVTSVTVVTFMTSGVSTVMYFCGDQQTLFPLNQTVQAEYTSGVVCSLLVRVVLIT